MQLEIGKVYKNQKNELFKIVEERASDDIYIDGALFLGRQLNSDASRIFDDYGVFMPKHFIPEEFRQHFTGYDLIEEVAL